MAFCTKCAAPLPSDASFCPRCGTPAPGREEAAPAAAPVETAPPPPPPAAAAAPPRATPPPHPAAASVRTPPAAAHPAHAERPARAWWIVPLVIVGVVVLAWLLLAGLPFGRGEERGAIGGEDETETIAEGTAGTAPRAELGTVVDVGGPAPPNVSTETDTGVTAEATVTSAPVPTVTVATTPTPTPTPAPVRTPAPATPPPARPAPTTPAPEPARQPSPEPEPARREISESEAAAVLRGAVTSRNYYEGVRPDCIEIRSLGYRNVGYGFSVWDTCVQGGGSRMLGRWRVDSITREVFVQRPDGRYLRP